MPGSGKGEFSTVAKELGIPVVVMGDIIRKEVARLGRHPTDENMGIVARNLRKQHGMAAIAIICIPVITQQNSPIVVVDGIRGDAEVAEFSKAFSEFYLVSIDAPLQTRFLRLSERGRSDDLQDIAELVVRDDRECSFGLGKAMDLAKVRIENSGTREEFQKKVRDFLSGMMGQ